MWAYMIGGLCLLYFIAIVIFGGVGSNFYFIWAVLGAAFISYGLLSKIGFFEQHIPIFLRRSFSLCLLLGVVLFIAVEGLIVSGFFAKGEKNLDYIVVLGAQVRKDGPSKVLAMRLDKAYEYLIENEQTVAVVSGGQGSNEPETEAACMRRYLEERGIDPNRIISEDQSENTVQNLTFSKKLMEEHMKQKGRAPGSETVGVVTNNFHVFRGVSIAKKLGYENAEGIAAVSYLPMQANNMLREFFGVMKDYLFGNM